VRKVKRRIGWVAAICLLFAVNAFAIDSEQTRLTLKGLKGVHVIVEDLQPNVLKYDKYIRENRLNKDVLKTDVEAALRNAGIRVLTWQEMLNTQGKPILYLNINTHESEKYWYGYNVEVELRQVVFPEINPKMKIMVSTWSINATGVANIGNLHVIKNDVMTLVGTFIRAYKHVNIKR
jgi:hypothetical protein